MQARVHYTLSMNHLNGVMVASYTLNVSVSHGVIDRGRGKRKKYKVVKQQPFNKESILDAAENVCGRNDRHLLRTYNLEFGCCYILWSE